MFDHHGVAVLPGMVGPIRGGERHARVSHDLGAPELGDDLDLPARCTCRRKRRAGWGAARLRRWRFGLERIEPGGSLLSAEGACGNLGQDFTADVLHESN